MHCEVNFPIEVSHSSLLSYSPLDLMSFAMEADSLRVEGKLQEAKNPASAVAEQSAGTAEVEQVQGMDMLMGMVGSIAAVPLLSDGENGMMHTGMEKAAESKQPLSVCPVLSMHGQWG